MDCHELTEQIPLPIMMGKNIELLTCNDVNEYNKENKEGTLIIYNDMNEH